MKKRSSASLVLVFTFSLACFFSLFHSQAHKVSEKTSHSSSESQSESPSSDNCSLCKAGLIIASGIVPTDLVFISPELKPYLPTLVKVSFIQTVKILSFLSRAPPVLS